MHLTTVFSFPANATFGYVGYHPHNDVRFVSSVAFLSHTAL
jgi:hypothetical protein